MCSRTRNQKRKMHRQSLYRNRRQQKKNKFGIEYGWNSTVFTTVEDFWEKRCFAIPVLDANESYEKIREQILRLNPMAEEKSIRKFIEGR